MLLVIEDLHWIDAETQALLTSSIESLPTARALLLVNYQPGYQHGWGSKQTTASQQHPCLQTVGELLQTILGNDPNLRPLKQLLIERTEGNPFFIEESVRTLVETTSGCRAETIVLPNRLRARRYRQRYRRSCAVFRLPPDEKRLLQSAAVIGKGDAPFALLQAIVDQSQEEIRLSLARLQAAEFLYETSLFPEIEYTFKHALTHEVAYGAFYKNGGASFMPVSWKRLRNYIRNALVVGSACASRIAGRAVGKGRELSSSGWTKAVGHWSPGGDSVLRAGVGCSQASPRKSPDN